MTENYYFYFAAHANAWLKMPAGRYPAPLRQAISLNSLQKIVFIYDEYENLLYTIPNADKLFGRLAATINKKYKLISKSASLLLRDVGGTAYQLDELLDLVDEADAETVTNMIEKALVKKGMTLKRVQA